MRVIVVVDVIVVVSVVCVVVMQAGVVVIWDYEAASQVLRFVPQVCAVPLPPLVVCALCERWVCACVVPSAVEGAAASGCSGVGGRRGRGSSTAQVATVRCLSLSAPTVVVLVLQSLSSTSLWTVDADT